VATQRSRRHLRQRAATESTMPSCTNVHRGTPLLLLNAYAPDDEIPTTWQAHPELSFEEFRTTQVVRDR